MKSIHWLMSSCVYQQLWNKERGTDGCTNSSKYLTAWYCYSGQSGPQFVLQSQMAQNSIASAMLELLHAAHQPEK